MTSIHDIPETRLSGACRLVAEFVVGVAAWLKG
jgi:hypothetical protein